MTLTHPTTSTDTDANVAEHCHNHDALGLMKPLGASS